MFQHSLTVTPACPMRSSNAFLPLKPRVFHVLLALHDGPRHGYRIKMAIKDRTNGLVDLDPGGLYRLIGRLEAMGLLEAIEKPACEADNEDSRRRYYQLTSLGREVVRIEARRLTDLTASADVAALAAEVGG